MSGEARISSRIDPKLKKQANAVLKKLGIKQSQAITMFYTQIAERKGLPFDVKVPNRETVAAMNENVSGKQRFNSVKDAMDDLND